MPKLSFAQYLLQSRTHPVLAHKSAFELYQTYQRLDARFRWFTPFFVWRRLDTN